jgi:hypothetical protein
MEKKCVGCHKILPFEMFNINRTRTDGRQNQCKTCKSDYNKTYNRLNNGGRREWKDKNPIPVLLARLKDRAKAKEVEFALTAQTVPPISDDCPCCGQMMIRATGNPGRNSPSLDRIIPHVGYVPGNVQWICYRCNAIKSDATPEELMRIAVFVAETVKNARSLWGLPSVPE